MTAPLYRPMSAPQPHMQFRYIDAAYKAAGATAPPNQYAEVRALIADTPSVDQVAAEYALMAYDTDTPAKTVTEATKAIEKAMAANALKDAFLKGERAAAARMAPDLTKTAALDITPAFNKDVALLTEAAQALDHNHPLDPERAVATDTGAALTTVRTILPRLATYASIYAVTPTPASPALNKLLAIISLPTIVRERAYRSLTEGVNTINKEEAAGTFTVRQLSNDATSDIDLTIIRIARGDYEGVALSLHVPGEPSRYGLMADVYARDYEDNKRLSFN